MALAGGRGEVVQPFDLLSAQLELIGGGVLLDTGDALGAGDRGVPGLRREEVAVLAGVSVDYYTRLERGNLSGVSEGVLEALARAFQLDEAERVHLFDLARAAQPATPTRRRSRRQRVRPGVQRMLDAMTGAPAFVCNPRLDILATNRLGRALYSEMSEGAVQPPNTARFAFLDPRATDL